MLQNTYVRIALFIALVIVLYYLVITLARSTAAADAALVPLGGSERPEEAALDGIRADLGKRR